MKDLSTCSGAHGVYVHTAHTEKRQINWQLGGKNCLRRIVFAKYFTVKSFRVLCTCRLCCSLPVVWQTLESVNHSFLDSGWHQHHSHPSLLRQCLSSSWLAAALLVNNTEGYASRDSFKMPRAHSDWSFSAPPEASASGYCCVTFVAAPRFSFADVARRVWTRPRMFTEFFEFMLHVNDVYYCTYKCTCVHVNCHSHVKILKLLNIQIQPVMASNLFLNR